MGGGVGAKDAAANCPPPQRYLFLNVLLISAVLVIARPSCAFTTVTKSLGNGMAAKNSSSRSAWMVWIAWIASKVTPSTPRW